MKVQLSAINSKITPVITDCKGVSDYVKWGLDNLLPQYLFDTYLNCSELQSLINTITDYIIGEGISSNFSNDDLEETVKKCVLDYILFGGFSVECIRNKMGNIAEINYINVMDVRVDEKLTTAFISNEWKEWGVENVQRLPLFKKNKQQAHFLLFYRGTITRNINPIPIWFSGLKSAETLNQTRIFNLQNITNNFSGGGVITLNGVTLSDEELKKITEQFEQQYCGSENAGHLMVVNNPQSDGKIEFIRFQPDNMVDLYHSLQESATNDLYVAFRINKMLVGQNVQTGFAKQEFEDAFKLFTATVIKPLQNNIIKVFESINVDLEFKPFKINWDNGTI